MKKPKINKSVFCQVKHPYKYRHLALQVLRTMFNKTDSEGKKRTPLHVYRCKACHFWHIGTDDAQRTKHQRINCKRVRVRYNVVQEQD